MKESRGRQTITTSILIGVCIFLLTACRQAKAPQTLILATTTSTEDSGLLDVILPDFEAAYGARVDVVAVGTGQAIALGEAGDADVILVHARSREDAFVAEGYGISRHDVMYNDFVVLGPADDPAGVAGFGDLAEALTRIAATESLFVSRGDDSGTHIREQLLWETTDLVPTGDWYHSVGQGMGATLTVAGELGAYTLSDRGTFIARVQEGLPLVLIVEGDPLLANPYGVVAINPELHPHVNAELAQDFISWLTSTEIQAAIATYRVAGEILFRPNAAGACPPDCAPNAATTAGVLIDTGPASLGGALWAALGLIFAGDKALWQVVQLSLTVSGIALILAAVVGIPAGAWLGLNRVRGERWLAATIYTGMGLPPVVVGLGVYLLLSQQGMLSRLDWLFTPSAMIVAQTILAFPLILGVTMSSVRGVNPTLALQLRSLGATEWQVARTMLTEARFGVIVGLVAGFGAAISEVGAVMLVGGNIAGQTRVLTTAIVLETRRGHFDLALALGIILLSLAFLTNVMAVWMQSREKAGVQ